MKIDVITLQNIFEDLKVVNYFIKRVETEINKTLFYQIKEKLIYFVIDKINRGVYQYDNVSYRVDRFYDKKDSNKLIGLTFFINESEYGFHQIVKDSLMTLISNKLYGIETAPYEETKEVFKTETIKQIQQRYINIVNILSNYNWCIFNKLDNKEWIKFFKKRYNADNIKFVDNDPSMRKYDKLVKFQFKGSSIVYSKSLRKLRIGVNRFCKNKTDIEYGISRWY